MATNPLGIRKFGPITFYVENAAYEAERLSKLLGMDIAHIPEGEEKIFGLQCGDVNFVLDGGERAAAEAKAHGNHIREIGICVNSVDTALSRIKKRTNIESGICEHTGCAYLRAPHDGGVYFKFSEEGQKLYRGIVPNPQIRRADTSAFHRIDHIVTNTQEIKPVIEFMQDVFGMKKVNEFTIRVETEEFMASLYSEVMGIEGSEHPVLFPVNEPLGDDDVSQIPAQLKEMGRSHAQHIALTTDDIISSIKTLRGKGLEFLEFRNEEHAKRYYNEVPTRLGTITVEEAIQTLRELGILVDKCGQGYLLQIFTTHLFPGRSVPFAEIIQRASDVIGCFGDGNFAALAESLEWAMRKDNQQVVNE